ncbi:MAG: cytochrome c peroxidase [bacterium]|nr:cytochrome c peroxidase [bacterium]
MRDTCLRLHIRQRRGWLFWCVIALLAGMTTVHAQQTTPALYALPVGETPVSSSSLALSEDGRVLLIANAFNDSLSIAGPLQSEVLAEIAVGADPRSVAFSADETQAFVTNRGDGTISVVDLATQIVTTSYPVGVLPYGLVVDEAGSIFVSVQGENEVIQLDPLSGAILTRIPTPPLPTGLALWGDFLYVTHLWSGEVSLIYLPQMQVVRTVRTGVDTALLQSITIDEANGLAYLPQSRSNAANPALTFDSTVFPVVNIINLRDLSLIRERRITLATADRPVNMPFAAVLDRRGGLLVVNAGSGDVSSIDLETGLARGHVQVGANPRSIAIGRDGVTAYVHNVIDGTITLLDMRNLTVIDVLPVSTTNIPVDELLGAQLFHSASDPRLSADGWLSCASCHFDGLSDGRVWAGINGGRNTPVLYDLDSTAPYTWEGEWDELADVELKIRALQAGTGLVEGEINPAAGDAHSGLSLDLDTLTTYLLTLQGPSVPPSPDTDLIERGQAVFEANDCAACHTAPVFTDNLRHDVGTGGEFDTPTLRWLWQSAPYFHDGRAAALEDVFLLPGAHQLTGSISPDDLNALVAYLLSLPHAEEVQN